MDSELYDKTLKPSVKGAVVGVRMAQEIDFVTLGMFIIGMFYGVFFFVPPYVNVLPRRRLIIDSFMPFGFFVAGKHTAFVIILFPPSTA